jgi:hypothetical protein
MTGVLSSSRTATVSQDESNEVEPPASYTVITAEYRVAPDGARTLVGRRIRRVKSNGEWRQSRYDSPSDEANQHALESAVLAATEEGVFAKSPEFSERKFLSKPATGVMKECFRSHKCLRNQLRFVRNGRLAGLKVYVLRFNAPDPSHPIAWVEKSYSPKTGYIPLRTVHHFQDGSEMVNEATSVEFREIPENLNEDLKRMPIKQSKKN